MRSRNGGIVNFFFGNSHLNNMFIIHNVLQWNNGVPKTIVSKPNIEEIIQFSSNLKIGKTVFNAPPKVILKHD